MRTSRSQDEHVAEVARRRLEALTRDLPDRPTTQDPAPGAGPPGPLIAGKHARRPVHALSRVRAWTMDRLPATVQGRVHLGSAQFGVVAVVVAVGLLATTWWLLRGGAAAQDVAVPQAMPAAALPTTPGTAPPTSGTAPADPAGDRVVVDVAGKVKRPGIVELPAGARVVDAIDAAGGLRAGARSAGLNLARLLVDGEQIVVGVRATVPAPAAASGPAGTAAPGATGALVDINTADAATLETLPGVGPVTAAAIIEWRAQHGPFTAVEELMEVSGIGPATMSQLLPHVTL